MIHTSGASLSALFAFLLLCYSAVAQPGSAQVQDTVFSRSKGREVQTIRFPNGSYAVQRFRDGKMDGVQEQYGFKGKLYLREEWKMGHRHGTTLRFDSNGKLLEKEQHVFVEDSAKSYLTTQEEYTNGRLRKRQQFAFGFPDGVLEEYGAGEKLLYRVLYKRGLKSGPEERFAADGERLLKGFNKIVIRNGKEVSVQDGEWKVWQTGGFITSVMRYRDGLKDGQCLEFYPDGKKKSDIFYKADKPFGKLLTWHLSGSLERSETQYADTLVNGKRQLYVYDGERLLFYSSGILQLKEQWRMGSKEGSFEKYYESGKLRERVVYRDHLKEGKEEYFDQDGILSAETFYVIRQKGDSLVSLKEGKQRYWKKGVLISETTFVNDLETGVRLSWYEDGTPASEYQVEDGVFSGYFKEYHQNGRLKRSGVHRKLKYSTGSRMYARSGWQVSYDTSGSILSKQCFDSLDNPTVAVSYKDSNLQSYDINRLMNISFFPDGGLKSFVIRNVYYQDVMGLWFFRNHRIRKLSFQDPAVKVVNSLLFDDSGRYTSQASSTHEQADSLKSSAALVQKMISCIPQNFEENPLITDSVRQGKYTLKYKNGAVMAQLHFKDDLPVGDWLLMDPVSADTLIYRFFVEGNEQGYYVDKFGGAVLLRRGRYPQDDEQGWEETYSMKGLPVQKITYRGSKGNVIERTEYYESGALKSFVNNITGANSSYDISGRPFYIYDFIADSLKRYREYHPGTTQLKVLRFYRSGKQDSVAYTWFANGKLQSEVGYRNGVRDGKVVTWNEKGDTLSSGTYVNDKLEGWMMDRTGGTTSYQYYENNKRVVNPGDFPCACVDTLYPSGRVKFAPTISSLLEYEKLQNYFAPWMDVTDSLNYKSVFFTGLQTDNRNGSGFASFNMMLFKEFAIDVPANKQLRVVLNPCRTKGYISRLETTLNYSENPRSVNVDFRPQRIELQLISGPVTSAIRQYPFPSLFVKTQSVSYTFPGKLSIDEPNAESHCMTPVRIRKQLRLEQLVAGYALFSRPDGLASGYLLSNGTVKESELKDFFGMTITQGQCILTLKKAGADVELKGIVKSALLGGRFASGYLQIPYTHEGDGRISFPTDAPNYITLEDIEKALINDGFRRVEVKLNKESKVLNIYWFAE